MRLPMSCAFLERQSACGRVILSVLGAAALVPAQDREPAAEPLLTVRIVAQQWGTEVPRSREKRSGYRLENHRIRWSVGPKVFRDAQRLERELTRIQSDPALPWRGSKPEAQPPVELQPGSETCVADVALTCESAVRAGFTNVRVGDLTVTLQKVSVAAKADLNLMPPAAVTAPVDVAPPWRPVLRVSQLWVVRLGDRVFYDPAVDGTEFKRLPKAAEAVLQEARGRGCVGWDRSGGQPREVIRAPLLVVVDRWTEWWLVDQLVDHLRAGGAVFESLQLAVHERDLEVEVLRRAAAKRDK